MKEVAVYIGSHPKAGQRCLDWGMINRANEGIFRSDVVVFRGFDEDLKELAYNIRAAWGMLLNGHGVFYNTVADTLEKAAGR